MFPILCSLRCFLALFPTSCPPALLSPPQSLSVSAWVYLDGKDTAAQMKTVVANRFAGCGASADRHGYAFYVNEWNTNNRQLILNWGDAQTGCLRLASQPNALEYDRWTHIGFSISNSATTATIFVNGAEAVSDTNIKARPHQNTVALHIGR